jgi:predicted DNA binding CopG/RHH family protein
VRVGSPVEKRKAAGWPVATDSAPVLDLRSLAAARAGENFREFLGRFGPHAGLAAWCCRITITLVAADAFIICRVTSETKERVRALAEREGINESTLLKQLLDVVLRTSTLEERPAPTTPENMSRDARVNVRLAPEVWRLLRERARARGMPSATYVSSLVRTHLLGNAPLPKAEYLALKQSVVELTAIGRNLNQIARALNQGGRTALPGQAEVSAMLKVAEGLRDHFRGLLSANVRSWEIVDAATRH